MTSSTATLARRAALGQRAWIAPTLVGLFALAVSLIGLGTPSVWYDEVATVSGSTRTLGQLWQLLGTVDAVHGAYYVLMHVVFELLGYCPFTLRLPSAAAVAITAGVVVLLGRRIHGPLLGLVGGVVFSILPRVTWMAVEGRSYALSAMMAAILSLVLLRAIAECRWRWWLVYAGVALLSCVTFLYLGLVVVAHGIGMLVALIRRGQGAGRTAAGWAASAGVAGLLTLPFLALVASQSSQLPAMEPLGEQTVTEVAVTQWFGTSIPWAVIGIAFIVFGLWPRAGGTHAGGGAILLSALVIPTAALLVVALSNPGIYQPRYLGMCTPFVALAIASGVVRISARPIAVAMVALLVVLAVPQFVSQRAPESKKDASWSTVAGYIRQQRTEHDGTTAIIFGKIQPHHAASARVIAYSYPAAFEGTVDVTLGIPAPDTGGLWETRLPLAGTLDRLDGVGTVFFITTEGAARRESTSQLLRRAGWVPRELWHADTVTVVRFGR
ncbi:glycosyltransferase family 39 protein [Salinibacterium sp.]|uniref:glycosyltransferase family 39 protein n=1 Tax=Salinibacterium sp. TaxID=1915057 RepID=UPI00286A79E4|nr:glycosyltransferase family 39 protein [Salinibacterium sp.]